jgi:Mg-chelatase subunit ChlD
MNKKNKMSTSGRLDKPVAAVIAVVTIAAQLFFPLASFADDIDTAPVPAHNPVLSESCGLDIAMVMDSSGSITDGTHNTPDELGQMKQAFKDFTASLQTTPSEFAVVDFDTTATLKQAFTGDPDLVNAAIDSVTSGGSTNWEDGLAKAQGAFVSGSGHQNLIILSSDGNPNKYGNNQGSGNGLDADALNAAINKANEIKGNNIRIVTLGIGNKTGADALNPDNLKAISGSGNDEYYDVTDFSQLGAALKTIATKLCQGTINVQKVIDADGDTATADDQTISGAAVEGWTFDVNSDKITTDTNGKAMITVKTAQSPFTVKEDLVKDGYGFASAKCVNSSDQPVGTLDISGNQIAGLTVSNTDYISCVFYNTPYCTTDVQCNDGDAMTIDACVDTHKCSHTVITPETPINGACGSASRSYAFDAIGFGNDQLCVEGTADSTPAFPAAGGSISWICNGINGGANSGSCIATVASAPAPVTPVNGVCGSANSQSFTSTPAANLLCGAGVASAVSGSGPWTWTCLEQNGGTDSGTCAASISASNGGGSNGPSASVTPVVSGGSGRSHSSSGQFVNGPRGVLPQVLGASINLDDIAAAIARIRAALATIAGEIAGMHLPSVLGAATMVSTGVLDN